jgi:mono/diheme cytochrome c family protein
VGASAPARLSGGGIGRLRKTRGAVAALAWGIGVAGLSGLVSPQAKADANLRSDADVAHFFGSVCGWCHEDGGRRAGKGPQLMGTDKSDDYIMNRIATGKPGKMPAFGAMFSAEDIQAIIHYIRNLKPEGASS